MSATIYRQIILDHYQHPRHFGELAEATVTRQHHNPSCGDKIVVQLRIKDGIIEDASFTGQGCALSIAGTSLLLDNLIGKNVSTIDTFTKQNMYDLLGIEVSAAREKCALLALQTLQDKNINE